MNADARLAKLDADHQAGYLSNSQYLRMRGLIEENPDFQPGVSSTKSGRKAGAIRRQAELRPGNNTPERPFGKARKAKRNKRTSPSKNTNRQLRARADVQAGSGFNLPKISSSRKPPLA